MCVRWPNPGTPRDHALKRVQGTLHVNLLPQTTDAGLHLRSPWARPAAPAPGRGRTQSLPRSPPCAVPRPARMVDPSAVPATARRWEWPWAVQSCQAPCLYFNEKITNGIVLYSAHGNDPTAHGEVRTPELCRPRDLGVSRPSVTTIA
jgi:hypothetical protein